MHPVTCTRDRRLKWACAALAMTWVFLAGTGMTTSQVLETSGCEDGRVECQANELAECVCREAWVDTLDGEKFLQVCHWAPTGEGCGAMNISPCTKTYEGVEGVFAGVRKECYCVGDDCYWRER